MAELLLSEGEKLFILHGVQEGLRNDGRGCEHFRQIEVETEVVTNTSGSARLRLANTEVLVGVKAEVVDVNPLRPDEGKLAFFVDCSANATPEFAGRGGELLATEVSTLLDAAYGAAGCADPAVDMKKLCIVRGHRCWQLTVDVLLLELGGNLFDVISMAVKAALFQTRVPVVRVIAAEGGGEPEIDVSDDPFDFWRPDVSNAPCFVTVTKIGKHHVVDTSQEEEGCSLASLVVGVTSSGHVAALRKRGRGSLDPDSVVAMTETALRVGPELNESLMSALRREEAMGESRTKVGFLGAAS